MKERERVEAEEEHIEAAKKKQEEERKKESQKVHYKHSRICVQYVFKYLFKLVPSCPVSCAAGRTCGDGRDAKAARRWEMLSHVASFWWLFGVMKCVAISLVTLGVFVPCL